MNIRFALFALVVSGGFVSVGYANMYNDWAQKKAVNLMCDINPMCSMGKAFIPSKERIRKMGAAIDRDSKALPRPNVGLISSDEISNYPSVNRYLTELDDKDISHYYILREDYMFQDLSGGSITIPAGFIWDGASIPSHRNGRIGALVEFSLEGGNTRYNSALAEGLIHDYMYRDPRRFTKEDADDLLYVNLMRCGNANPIAIYEGVHVAGGDSYQGHKKRQDQGLYDVFTPEFYNKNKAIYQSRLASHKPEVFGRDSQSKRDDQYKEKICHADYVPVNDFRMTDSNNTNSVNSDNEVGVRGWCHCWDKTPPYSGCLKEVGIANIREDAEWINTMAEISQTYDGAYCYTICDQCGKCYTIAKVGEKWHGAGDEIVDAMIINNYKDKAGVSIPTHQFEGILAKARDGLLVIPDGQIVIGGICSCKYPDPMRVAFQIPFGEYYVCVFCGRVRLPDDTGSIPLGPTEWERRMGRSGKPFPGFEK